MPPGEGKPPPGEGKPSEGGQGGPGAMLVLGHNAVAPDEEAFLRALRDVCSECKIRAQDEQHPGVRFLGVYHWGGKQQRAPSNIVTGCMT